jgi:protein-disulfide isomerase
MLSIIKVFVLGTLLFSSSILANSIDDKVIDFEKKRFSQNKNIKIKSVSINMKKEMPQKGWYGYIIDLNATIAGNEIRAKDIVFASKDLITPELFDINSSKSLKDLLTPKLTKKYYDKSKLIAGNHNAKDKIVIFSDPLCPFCMDYVPDIIEFVNKNSNDIALYYYHYPILRAHPAASVLIKLMNVAKRKNIKDIELKVYNVDWDEYFSSKEKSSKKILEAFNKELNTSIELKDINNKKANDEIKKDVQMAEDVMVSGTPTIFINGEIDKTKIKYETLGK